MHEAKTNFSKLLAQASAGEDVIITSGRKRKPVAKLIALPQQVTSRVGFAMDWPSPGPQFFEPMSEEELALWSGDKS